MFLLQGLSTLVFGKEEHSLCQLPSGQLFHRNPTDPRNPRQLIYKDASATITPSSTPFNYRLLITRVYEEGEQELNQDLDDQKSFLLDPILKFRSESVLSDEQNPASSRAPNLIWFDLDSAGGISTWEFVVDMSRCAYAAFTSFESTLYRCMFERKFGKSVKEAPSEDVESFIIKVKAIGLGQDSVRFIRQRLVSLEKGVFWNTPKRLFPSKQLFTHGSIYAH